jgi:hypothetical protein
MNRTSQDLIDQMQNEYQEIQLHANTLIPLMYNSTTSKRDLQNIKQAIKGVKEYKEIIDLIAKHVNSPEIIQALHDWSYKLSMVIYGSGSAGNVKESRNQAYKLIDSSK